MKQIITPLMCWWVALVQRNAALVLVILALMVVASAAFSAKHFAIDSDLDKFISQTEQNQWHKNNEIYRKTFPNYHRNAVVVVSGASAEETYFAAEKIYYQLKNSELFDDVFAPIFDPFITERVFYNLPTEGVKILSEKVSESIPSLASIYHQPSIETLIDHLASLHLQASEYGILMPEVAIQLQSFDKAIEQLMLGEEDPIYLMPKMAPPDTDNLHFQLIAVKRAPDLSEKLPNKAIMDDIHTILNSVAIAGDVDVRVTGEIAMMNDEITESLDGFNRAGQISIALIFIILWLGIRSKRLIVGTFLMLFASTLFSIAFTLVVFKEFNTLSLVFVVMLFGLGIDFAVHFCLRVMEAMGQGEQVEQAGMTATRETGVALGLCALTTVIAFTSFIPTDYRGMAELGVISAFGMVVAYFLSLTFMPAWFIVARVKPIKVKKYQLPPRLLNLHYPAKTILALTIVLLSVSSWYISDTSFNYNVLSMRNPDSEAMLTLRDLQDNHIVNSYAVATIVDKNSDLHALKQRLEALDTVAVVELPEEHLPAFQDVKYHYLSAVAEQLQALGEVGQTQTVDLAQTYKKLDQLQNQIEHYQDEFLDEDFVLLEDLYESLKALKERQDVWEALQKSIAEGINEDVQQLRTLFSAKPFGLDDLPADIRSRLISDKGEALVQIIPAVDMSVTDENRRFIEELMSVQPNISGVAVHEWGVGQVMVSAFTRATSLSVVMIFLVIALTFKSIKPAIMILVPLALVITSTLSIAKMIGMSLNMANILVVPLIFGLGVDTGIHVVNRYRLSDDWKHTLFSSTGRAVLLSALTTIGTFVAIGFSQHQGAASIGILLSIALSLLIIITFVVLPALLVLFDPKQPQKSA